MALIAQDDKVLGEFPAEALVAAMMNLQRTNHAYPVNTPIRLRPTVGIGYRPRVGSASRISSGPLSATMSKSTPHAGNSRQKSSNYVANGTQPPKPPVGELSDMASKGVAWLKCVNRISMERTFNEPSSASAWPQRSQRPPGDRSMKIYTASALRTQPTRLRFKESTCFEEDHDSFFRRGQPSEPGGGGSLGG